MNDTIHYGLKIYEEIIPNALKKLDPNNLYWPSSPFGGEDAELLAAAGISMCGTTLWLG